MSGWVAGARGRRLAGAGACAVMLVLAYLAVAAWAGTRSARGTTVAGVEVGGLDRTSVRQRLDRQVAPRADRPLEVTAGSGTATLVPTAAGLRLDASATAAQLVGFSLRRRTCGSTSSVQGRPNR